MSGLVRSSTANRADPAESRPPTTCLQERMGIAAMASTIKILILDDQGLVRAGMRELIRISEPNANIFEASSYEEAVALLAVETIDFAFLDYDLKSVKTGLDVLKHIRESELETYAIMLSGRCERELAMECISAGACGYINKDMSDDEVFRDALNTALRGGIFMPAALVGRAESSKGAAGSEISLSAMGVSGRCVEVLSYICQGLPNKAIAKKMNVEEGTIRKDYVPKLFRIFKVARRTELLIEVARLGIQLPTLDKSSLASAD